MHWLEYEGTDEKLSWIPVDEVHTSEAISNFYSLYPDKPRSLDSLWLFLHSLHFCLIFLFQFALSTFLFSSLFLFCYLVHLHPSAFFFLFFFQTSDFTLILRLLNHLMSIGAYDDQQTRDKFWQRREPCSDTYYLYICTFLCIPITLTTCTSPTLYYLCHLLLLYFSFLLQLLCDPLCVWSAM